MSPNEIILSEGNSIKYMIPLMLWVRQMAMIERKGVKNKFIYWNFVWLGDDAYRVRCYGCIE